MWSRSSRLRLVSRLRSTCRSVVRLRLLLLDVQRLPLLVDYFHAIHLARDMGIVVVWLRVLASSRRLGGRLRHPVLWRIEAWRTSCRSWTVADSLTLRLFLQMLQVPFVVDTIPKTRTKNSKRTLSPIRYGLFHRLFLSITTVTHSGVKQSSNAVCSKE